MKLTRKKFWSPDGRIEWCVTGEYGSLSFWAIAVRPESITSFGETHYGGVESHYNEKSKPSYKGEPDRHDCAQNGGKCWHDGTSLWASEYWIPRVMPLGDEHIFSTLESYYDERMKPEAEVAA